MNGLSHSRQLSRLIPGSLLWDYPLGRVGLRVGTLWRQDLNPGVAPPSAMQSPLLLFSVSPALLFFGGGLGLGIILNGSERETPI